MIVLWAVLGVVAAMGVALAVRRNRRHRMPRVAAAMDPFTVGEPWRRHVAAAESARRRYAETVALVAAGPTRDRLTAIGVQLGRGVAECGQIARRGDQLDEALRRLDAASIARRLERATDDEVRRSLQAQLDSATRIRATRDSTDAKLRTLDARLGEMVAKAAELGASSDATSASGDELGGAVDDVVTELEALRLAIADVDRAGTAPVIGGEATGSSSGSTDAPDTPGTSPAP